MTDLVSRTAAIAAKARAAQPTREANRQEDPDMAAAVDEYRRRFGGELVAVRWKCGRTWTKRKGGNG